MQDKVYKTKIRDVNELHQRILEAWDKIDQRVIDESVQQWRQRLRPCVSAHWGHFEHQL